MQDDPAYMAGRFLGPALVALLIGYIIVRLSKKRNPNSKEWLIIGLVGLGLAAVMSLVRSS